ncbi:response regulator of citrate/malate metabolism [Crossiella equi]|uniref:Transcriptional regulatory protein n=1 Tax=Crossiella equi TaxID=130796 RepID=A0ABS5AGV9_9PSEU|nr:response regulator [Crossiella equi]MBP2475819.1 response regulator of citrate/malate metabolism [Crossiella equi]
MIRVLVVDDDFMVAKVHSGYVARTPGFEVVGVAHTAADAIRLAGELRPDLVLLDVYLPDADGVHVLRELRAGETGDVDVIMVTAARDVDTVRAAVRGGVVHYLIKPFEYAALRDQLAHYAQVRQRLTGAVDQAVVDQVFGARPTSAPVMPKGLTPETAKLVEEVLRGAETDLSATEAAAEANLSRVSARRYLEHFVGAGRAEVRLRYGSTGRPERRYRWLD